MEIQRFGIAGVMLITPRRFGDSRGWFTETYRASAWSAAGVAPDLVQDNHSYSAPVGTLRGLHCQIAPRAQGKLVRVLRGAIFDVAVDIRGGSPTYGQHVGAVLSAENNAQIWVPVGFLHGFCTLEPDTEVAYKCTAEYDRVAERGVRWDDPTLGIDWPVAPGAAVLSDKDRALPDFAAAAGWFP
jgi:dTDP-4-dehydrorhamnose 3,5-epimerase